MSLAKVAHALCLSASDAAKKEIGEAEKKRNMFEPVGRVGFASRFADFVFGNPKGSGCAVAFFCLLFLARQEK